MSRMDHYYVYTFQRDGDNGRGTYYYERTCGTERGAKNRVKELEGRGQEAMFLINHTIRGAFY